MKVNTKGVMAMVLLLAICLIISAKSNAQKITYSGKNVSLQTVFDVIRQQTGYGVFIEDALLSQTKNVSVQVKEISINDILRICFKSQPVVLEFYIAGRSIIIRKKENQDKKISTELNESSADGLLELHGHITDSTGHPLLGISITVKGSNISTISDVYGNFTLARINPNATIRLSSIGYEPKEYKVDGKTDVSIWLSVKINQLSNVEVVYSNGYQQVNKERQVGSFSQLDSANYNRRAGMAILDRLDGTVSGVLFDKKNGGIANVSTIQVRGVSTLQLPSSPSPNPLIILDNFPYAGDLTNINPNDVENITILKDAAAASIWGSRAGNGVIVINTKSGRYNQQGHLSLVSNVTIQEKPDLYYYPRISTPDEIDVEEFLFKNGYYNAILNNTSTRPIVSPIVEILAKQRAGTLSQQDAVQQIDAFRNLDLRNSENKYLYRPGVLQQHYLNFSGGSNTLSYLISGGYNKTNTNIQGSKPDDQFTVNSNLSLRPVKNLEIKSDVNFTQSRTKSTSLPLKIYPYGQLTDSHGVPTSIPYQYRQSFIDTAGGSQLLDWQYRPLDEIRLTDNTIRGKFIRLNLGASYKITPWLTAEARYQYVSQETDSRNLHSLASYFTRDIINRFTNPAETDPHLRNPVPMGGILDLNNSISSNHFLRGQMTANKAIGYDHSINALVAGEISEASGSISSSRLYGYDDEFGTYVSNIDYYNYYPIYDKLAAAMGTIPGSVGYIQANTTRIVSLLANLSYTYKGRYTFYTSGRRDGANVFGVNSNNRWKPLWSVGGAWDISKEPFYKSTLVSYIRARASFGYSGNVSNGLSGLPSIFYTGTSNITALTQAQVGNAPNPDLRWEQVRTINIGIDFSMLKNRLSGTIEFFHKRSIDLISPVPFDPTTGITDYTVNSASLKGHGFELTLNSINTKGIIKWETNFNLSHVKMIVDQFYSKDYASIDYIAYGLQPLKGRLAYGLYGYKWAGLDPATGDPRGYLNGKISTDYTSILNDSIQHQLFIGSSLPLYVGYLRNSVSYKNFTLSANITYRLGFYFRKTSIDYSTLFDKWQGSADYSKRWKNPGDEKNTSVPSMLYPLPPALAHRDEFYAGSSVNILRGDNIRLQDIRLQYVMDKKSWARLPVQSIQLFVYANNLNMIIWRKTNSPFDPDYAGGQNDPNLGPLPRNWTMGINLTF